MPLLAAEHGKDMDGLIFYVHVLMALLFAGWMAYFIYVLFRFRKSRNPQADHAGVKSHASSYIEGAVVIFEAVLLLGFAVPLWAKVADKFPAEKDSTVIRVTAQQFAWNSRYPGKDGVFGKQNPKFVNASNAFGVDPNDPAAKDDVVPPLNEMAVPVNKPVIAHITSMDVIHSFKIYPLRVNQDATPGLRVPIHFTPTKEGKYQIVCAQLCGNSHYFMKGYFTVYGQKEYDEWLDKKSKSSSAGSLE
ncbi:MAG: cytochrome c oxidase subunit II [Verrucomicrobia bacterium]|nr:cytochrome c oxidase subunit II [Verrucomicrobiota bacterium]